MSAAQTCGHLMHSHRQILLLRFRAPKCCRSSDGGLWAASPRLEALFAASGRTQSLAAASSLDASQNKLRTVASVPAAAVMRLASTMSAESPATSSPPR